MGDGSTVAPFAGVGDDGEIVSGGLEGKLFGQLQLYRIKARES